MEIKREKNKFYIGENSDNVIAEITFIPQRDGNIMIDHTYVSKTLKGQGVGAQLVKQVVDYALSENIKIVPACSFAKKVMTENEEYIKCICD